VISILAAIAKQESIRLSERVQAGLARARNREMRLGRPKKIVDASKIAHLRLQGHSWREITEETEIGAKELHSGPLLACPKTYEFRLPTFLSGIASFQDPYLINGWFMGNHWTREGNARRPPSLIYAFRWAKHLFACSPVLSGPPFDNQ